jgi:hypothetical protein
LIGGDWKITSTQTSFNPLAHTAVRETWVHYVDTLGAGYCAVSLENPKTMYCQLTRCDDLWKCRPQRAPSFIHERVAPIEPTLAQELQLFRLIHKRDLGTVLGAAPINERKLKTAALSIEFPYRVIVPDSQRHWSDPKSTGFDRELIEYRAEIELGPKASDVRVGAREVRHVVERCTYPADHQMRCMPVPPRCVDR